MSNITTTLQGFGNNDLAKGEARVYNHYTGNRIMTVDVDGVQLDEAYAAVMRAINEHIERGCVVDIEIDQMPYSEVRG
jgi:hypothetical protein